MMKQKLLFTFALLLTAVTGAWADGSWTSGGCDVTLVGGTLTVSKSSSGDGAMENYASSNNQPWNNSRNNITSVVIGDGVTSIGNYAFRGCDYLTSVTIGSNVGSIGTSAFDVCIRLASVSIPASVTSIGDFAFVSCGTSAAALVVTIADGSLLSSIGVQAFFNAKLASFNIPASVTNIGSNAFYNCSNLSSVVIHATSVPTCGNDAFGNYKSGRKIYVPAASVDTYKAGWTTYANDIIGYNGTCGATDHEWDVLWALTGESSNYTLNIMKVGETGAMKNSNVENVPWYNERNNITSVVIGDGVTAIGQYAFYDCSNLASLTIGSSLQTIGIWAFSGCSKLASVNLPASVTNIGSNAFYNCSNLSSVVIHATSVPTCGNDAFGNYKSGRKIFVPAASVDTYKAGWTTYAADIIGYNGTCGATGHESDVVYALTGESPNRTLYISGTGAMKDDYKPWSDFTTVIIGDGVTHIGKQSFDYLIFTSLTIGNGVKSIGELAFHNCSGLTSIVIPNSVETIGKKAFEFITTLTSLTIGSGVTSMADNAFDYCENVTSLTISDGVTTIGKGAFETYSSLTSVVIPSSVTSIGENAFNKCPQLSSVVIRSPSLTTYGSQAFDENKDGRNIFVPAANLNAYRTGWTTYANDIIGYNGTCGATGNESNVVYALTGTSPNCTLYIIGTGAMMDCGDGSSAPWYSNRGDITSVVIGDGVTTIGAHAFGQNNNTLYTHLTSLTIGNDVTTIGDYAFYYCTGLTSIVIPNSVQTIKSYAFQGCSGVTSLTIGSGVTTLEDHAFYGLGITSVIIPANVTHIYNSVFNSCSNLSSVVIQRSSLTNYGYKVFNDNASGRKIFVPSGSEDTYKDVWKDTEWGNYVDDIIGYGGTCGATGHEWDVLWALTGESPNYTLNIVKAGTTGAMADYEDPDNRPWKDNVGYITSIVIGDGVTNIGQAAFMGCNNASLGTVTIPTSVETIGIWAFKNCSMTSVTLPASVKSIGNSSFSECNKLTSVTLNSNPQIQPNAFPVTATVTMNLTANPVDGDYWMTFFNDGYHFKADEYTTVYKGTLSGNSISLTEVTDKIVTKGNAVILKSTGNPVMTLNSAESSDMNSNNLQGVSDVNGIVSDGSYYVLNNGGSGVGFYKLKSGKTLGYGKAYLSGSNAPSYLNFEENETTEIREVKEVNGVIEVNDNSWYTLDGRKMDSKPTAKGLYIVNGKKVVIK